MQLDSVNGLWFLVVIPLFLYAYLRAHAESNRWRLLFAGEKAPLFKSVIPAACLCLSLGLMALALAQPKALYTRTYFNRTGISVAVGIDVSKSMLAEDSVLPAEGRRLFSLPSRLNCARYFVVSLLSGLDGIRAGLYMFASGGVELIPFTSDYGYCRYILTHLQDADITVPGSDLGAAVMQGVSMFENSPEAAVKIIVLVSDGEDISVEKSSLYDATRTAAAGGIRIYTVGIGLPRGVLIPIRAGGENAIEDYFVDDDGSYLKTALNQGVLKNIAEATGGRYFHAGDSTAPRQLIDAIIQDAKRTELTQSTAPALFDVAPFCIAAALLCFAAGALAKTRLPL